VGAAIGASLWMPATALASDWPAAATVAATAAAGAVLISVWLLWRRRTRMSALHGLMALLTVGFLATLLFFAAAAALDLTVVNQWPAGKRVPALKYAWVLLFYPALAGTIWLRARRDATPKNET
jgi:hypothetical protein